MNRMSFISDWNSTKVLWQVFSVRKKITQRIYDFAPKTWGLKNICKPQMRFIDKVLFYGRGKQTCTLIYVYTYTLIHTHIHTKIYRYIYTHTCTQKRTYSYTWKIETYTRAYWRAYMQVCMHIHLLDSST